MKPSPELAAAHEFCRLFARINARHFYYAFLVMPQAQRRSIHAVYAFCQKADQLVDLEPDPAAKRERIAERRAELALLERRLAGDDLPEPEDPILLALTDTLTRHAIPLRWFHELLDGLEMDLERHRYASFAELEEYCRRVASAVGRMVIVILGHDGPEEGAFADRLGIAMQLTNICRDVLEDGRGGRVYLPAELLSAHGLDADGVLAACREPERFSPAFGAMILDLCTRADRGYDEAFALLPAASRRPLRPARVMAELYRPILAAIRARGGNVLLGKVGYPIWRKLWIALRVLAWG
jgi:15-cis-phytoene synthase